MKRLFSLILALCIALSTLVACTEAPTAKPADLVLAKDGVSNYQIVLPKGANDAWKQVANILQDYFERITDINLPVVTEDEAESEYEIVLGKTNRYEGEEKINRSVLGKEGFCIRNVGQRIFIAGALRGTLYGIYEFIEEFLGHKFYSTNNSIIKKKDEVVISPFEENVQLPGFEWRRHSHDYGNGMTMRTNSSWGGPDDYIGGEWSYAKKQVCHTFGPLLGWSKTQSYHTQPCLTDEEVYEKMLAGARKWMEEDPTAEIISITQNDGAIQDTGECTCDNCVASNEKYGSSGTLLNFVNRIAAELKKDYPNLMIETLAYIHTEEVPKGGVVPADNVIIRFATMGGCHMHSLTGEAENPEALYPAGTNRHYKNLSEWAKVADKLYIWDYDISFGSVFTFVPNFRRLYDNVHFFHEIGVDGVFIQGMGESGEFDHLRSYLSAKLLWNPAMSYEEFEAEMLEFMQYYYGDGYEDVLFVIDYVTELIGDTHPSMYHDMIRFYPHTKLEDGTTDKSHVETILSRFESAMEKAKDEAEKNRVERSSVPFHYYRSTLVAMDVTNSKAELSDLVAINEHIYAIMQRESLTALREGLGVPEIPNLKNTLLYWRQGGECIFNPTTEQAFLNSQKESEN